MKRTISLGWVSLLTLASASAQGLYYLGTETEESLPLKWVVGANVIYDDNVSPGYGEKESSVAINPTAAVSFVSMSPQTTWDVYVRLGLIYYFDAPDYMDEINPQTQAGVNFTHRFSERLRFSSRNFIAYELEPDYSYGYASARRTGAYLFWQTDNSLGYRWTERFATYTGLRLGGTSYEDVENNDRFTWEAYNQFRYQLSTQTVLTGDYRYSQTAGQGVASDTDDHFLLAGIEHRFSPTIVGIARVGSQFHSVDGGDSYTSPYLELAMNARATEDLSVRMYTRYGIEANNNVETLETGELVEFDDQAVLRFGVSGEYRISPRFSIFGGVDYIPISYEGGHLAESGISVDDESTDIINAYIGVSMKFNDRITGTLSYNYTQSDSDFRYSDYDRNRVTIGVNAEF